MGRQLTTVHNSRVRRWFAWQGCVSLRRGLAVGTQAHGIQ
jgi:hypothetical protein